MAKVLKAVVVGALIGLTAGLLTPALVPALSGVATGVFGAGAFNSFVVASAVGGGILGGALGVVQEFVEVPKIDTAPTIARNNLSINVNEPGKIVFGTTPCATDVVFSNNYGSNRSLQVYVVAAAAHKVHSFGDLWVEDAIVSFSGDAATGAWADTLWKTEKLGTEPQTAIGAIGGDSGHAWPSTAKFEGHAHYMLKFKIGKEKTKNGVATTRVAFETEGCPVYDPRKDSTRGGSGTHRADDQSTWEFDSSGTLIGENWALQVLTYLIGWRTQDGAGDLVWGRGADPDDIDMPQAMAAANVCEEIVDSKWRFRTGGVFPTDGNHQKVISEMEAQIGGKVAKVGGRYFIWAPNNDLAGAFSRIDEADDVFISEIGIEHDPSGSLEHLFNTARGRFIDPAQMWQLVPYPEVPEATFITEDGRERLLTHDFTMIQDVSIAERVMRYLIRRSRYSGTWRFALGPYGLRFQPFDVTTLNCQETNNTDTTVRVINMEYSLSGIVIMEVIEEDASIYDTSAALGTPATINDVTDVDPAHKVAVAGLGLVTTTVTGSSGTRSDGLKVSWTDPSGFVKKTEVQYKPAAETDWQQLPDAQIDFTSAVIAPLLTGTSYNVRVRHITIFDVLGDWSSATLTTGTNEIVATAVTNFNNRNDRDNTAITTPTIASDGTAIDHVVRDDGSVDISFEYGWTGTESDIDGFVIYHRVSTSGTSYNFGTTPAEELTYYVPADKRVFYFMGVSAKDHHTFGVQAYRVVDPDVDASGLIKSTLVQCSLAAEDPYQPATSVAHAGDVTGTVDGTSATTVKDGAALGATSSQVPSLGLGAKKNYDSFSNPNNGEFYIHGFDKDGAAADVDGYVKYNGAKTTVTKGAVWTGGTKSGYDALETGAGTPFAHGGSQNKSGLVFKEDATWKYDKNGPATTFTVTNTMIVIGTVDVASADNLNGVTIWDSGVNLALLGELADKDDVDTGDIIDDAVSGRYHSTVASFTSTTLSVVIVPIDIPDQGHYHDAILIATMNAWINTDISGGPHKVLIGADTNNSGSINGVVQTATITATASPGEVIALQIEKNPSNGDAWDYQVEYLGTSVGDKVDIRDLAWEVLLMRK